jgi:hypothetical protein
MAEMKSIIGISLFQVILSNKLNFYKSEKRDTLARKNTIQVSQIKGNRFFMAKKGKFL